MDGGEGRRRTRRSIRWLVEAEILPRLAERYAGERGAGPSRTPARVTDADRDRFLDALTRESAASALDAASAVSARGIPTDAVLLDLLSFAARRLGEWWEDDRASLADVTIGAWRLHEVLRRSDELERPSRGGRAPGPDPDRGGRRILLATVGGDPHILGLLVVARLFRRAGWRVSTEPGGAMSRLAALLARSDFDVLGLSAARSVDARALGREIRALVDASRNQGLLVLVGGHLFDEDPGLAARVGANLLVADARSAPERCEALLRTRQRRRPRAARAPSPRPHAGR